MVTTENLEFEVRCQCKQKDQQWIMIEEEAREWSVNTREENKTEIQNHCKYNVLKQKYAISESMEQNNIISSRGKWGVQGWMKENQKSKKFF